MNRLDSSGYNTDKGASGFLDTYHERFKSLADSEICLLELGICGGGSLLMWRDYFPKGVIAGLDCDPVTLDDPTGRIHVYRGLQQDSAILDKIRMETARGGFDIIIDDASHFAEFSYFSFWHLFDNHLKPGGVYIIEDWGVGYWDKWPDGKKYYLNLPRDYKTYKMDLVDRVLFFIHDYFVNNRSDKFVSKTLINACQFAIGITRKKKFRSHNYGMVGLLKQLVDEMGMGNITTPNKGTIDGWRGSKFTSMEIFSNLVFIRKSESAFFKVLE